MKRVVYESLYIFLYHRHLFEVYFTPVVNAFHDQLYLQAA